MFLLGSQAEATKKVVIRTFLTLKKIWYKHRSQIENFLNSVFFKTPERPYIPKYGGDVWGGGVATNTPLFGLLGKLTGLCIIWYYTNK